MFLFCTKHSPLYFKNRSQDLRLQSLILLLMWCRWSLSLKKLKSFWLSAVKEREWGLISVLFAPPTPSVFSYLKTDLHLQFQLFHVLFGDHHLNLWNVQIVITWMVVCASANVFNIVYKHVCGCDWLSSCHVDLLFWHSINLHCHVLLHSERVYFLGHLFYYVPFPISFVYIPFFF